MIRVAYVVSGGDHDAADDASEMSDPRVSGTGIGRISVDAVGSFGWETVNLVVENEGGTCSGAIWSSGNASDFSCWLLGTGDYQGLTYYLHSSSFASTSEDEGVILPLPAPETP